ncbi:MAG TPA: hypothetical protein PK566_17195 [Pseudobacteroides sp.]|nr:hypothetical protein [Pseudobacteroides sp.]
MPNFFKHITIKLMQSLVEIIFIFPILLALAVHAYQDGNVLIIIAGLIPFYLTGILLNRLQKNKSNAFYVIISLIIGISSSLVISTFKSFSILYTIMASFSIFRGTCISKNSWLKQSPIPLFNLLLASYLVFNVLYLMSGKLSPYVGLLNAVGLVMIVVFLSICSVEHLREAFYKTGNKTHIPSSLLKSNITSLIIILVLIIALSMFKPFWKSIITLVKSIIVGIYSILNHLSSDSNNSSVGMSEIKMFGRKFSSSISILEIIFNIMRIAVIIGFAFLTIYVIFKFIHKIAVWLSSKRQEDIVKESTLGYVDERELLLKSSSKYWSNVKSFLHLFNKDKPWKDLLTNRDKVRFIYRQKILSFIKKGFKFNKSLTPNELSKDIEGLYKEDISDLAACYNKARYSYEDIEDSELEAIIKNHKD